MTVPTDEILKKLKKKAGAAARILNSPDGRVLMDALRTEFVHLDLRGKTTEDTYYNLGSRDVVKYLEQLVKFEEKQDG